MQDKRMYLTDEEKRERFRDRFANDEFTGVNKLTSVGCMKRFDIPREEVYLNNRENKQRNWEYANRAEREEQRLVGTAARLFAAGHKLLEDESIEDFIERIEPNETE
jgi:hypothetical protein